MTDAATTPETRAVLVPLTQLHPAPWNPRTATDSAFKALCRSLEADPALIWHRPVLARKDGEIYAGNYRYRAAEALGWDAVPAVLEDVSDQVAKERAIRDNNGAGTWVEDQLAALLADLAAHDAALDLLGFDDGEVDRLLASLKPVTPPEDPGPQLDRAAELQEKWQTARGQLWLIPSLSVPGRAHRLLCGDSTDAADVARLMGGERAVLLATDPPYNVGVEYGDQVDDGKLEADYEAFTRAWFSAWSVVSERQIVTPGCVNLAAWCRYFKPYHLAPWTKTNSMTNGKVARWWCWEPVFFFGEQWTRGRPNDVFDFPVSNQKGVANHPCPKPLPMWVDLLTNYSAPGDLVADAFDGAGTTLVAAEQIARICYANEMEPKYVAVALERLQGLGLTPRRDGG